MTAISVLLCLKRLSREHLALEPEDGAATIGKAYNTFPGGIADFTSYGTDVKGKPTERQNVEVHEMVKAADFKAIFTSLSENLDSLCLSQAQIIQFCEKYRDWLRTEGCGTFFLFKVGIEFFVAGVFMFDGAWGVCAYCLSCDFVWRAQRRHRVVVPQFAQ